MPTAELKSPKGLSGSGAAKRYLAALRNEAPLSTQSPETGAQLTKLSKTKTTNANNHTYAQRHNNLSSPKGNRNATRPQAFASLNKNKISKDDCVGSPTHSISRLRSSVGGAVGVNSNTNHKRLRPQSFFASMYENDRATSASKPIQLQNEQQQQSFLNDSGIGNRSSRCTDATTTTTYPLQAQLEEEAMQSRNGSTSPSRLRPSRCSLNVGLRDSICEDESPKEDKWTENQWMVYRSKLHPPPYQHQHQEDVEKRKQFNASPVMTDVSENPTEITNNLNSNKQIPRVWQNPTRNGNVGNDDGNGRVDETSPARNFSSHAGVGPLHKNISAQNFTFDLTERKTPEEYVTNGDSAVNTETMEESMVSGRKVTDGCSGVNKWRRRRVTNDTGWIKKRDGLLPPATKSSLTNTNCEEEEKELNTKLQPLERKAIEGRYSMSMNKPIGSPSHRGSTKNYLSRQSSTSCSTESNEDNKSKINSQDPSPQHQHRSLGHRKNASDTDSGGKNKSQWGKYQLRPVRPNASEQPKLSAPVQQQRNTREGNKDDSISCLRVVTKSVKFNPVGGRTESQEPLQTKEEKKDNEKSGDSISIRSNDPTTARSDTSAVSSEFLSVKSRLRSWNRRNPETESVDTQNLRSPTGYLPFRSSPSASPLRLQPAKPVINASWHQAPTPNSFLSQLKSRKSEGRDDATKTEGTKLPTNEILVEADTQTGTQVNVTSRYNGVASYTRKWESGGTENNEIKETDHLHVHVDRDNRTEIIPWGDQEKESTVDIGCDGKVGSLKDRVNRFSSASDPQLPSSPSQPSWRRRTLRPSTKKEKYIQSNETLSNTAEEEKANFVKDESASRKLKPTPGGRSQSNVLDDENRPNSNTVNQGHKGVRGIRSRFESMSRTRSISPKQAKITVPSLEKRVWNSKYGASLVKPHTVSKTDSGSQEENEPAARKSLELIDTSSSNGRENSKPVPWKLRSRKDDVIVPSEEIESSTKLNSGHDPISSEEVESETNFTKSRPSGINSIRSKFEALSNTKGKIHHGQSKPLENEESEQDGKRLQESVESNTKISENRKEEIYCASTIVEGEQTQNIEPPEEKSQVDPNSTLERCAGLEQVTGVDAKVERQPNVKRFQQIENVDVDERNDESMSHEDESGAATENSSSQKAHKIGHVENSAFEHIQKSFGGGKSITTSLYPVNSGSVNEFADCKGNERELMVEETTISPRRSIEIGQNAQNLNDIPWAEKAPNDIPWNGHGDEKQPTTPKPAVDMTYGVEYLDCSYDDDDCDGVTLSPTPSDVSSLSIPTCLQSIETSVVSESTATSDGDTGTMESATEKQSTALGPSEASSSQTSEAATPLIASTLGNMKFGLMTSSDTTGPSLSTNHYTDLLGTLPPPIDDPTDCKDLIDNTSFQSKEDDKKSFGSSKQFEDQLNIQSIPKWKNDFFAVDSVKSHPTTESLEATNWVAFPEDTMSSEFHFSKPQKDKGKVGKMIPTDSTNRGRKHIPKIYGDDNLKSIPTSNRGFDGESKRSQEGRKSLHNKKYNLDSVQEVQKEPFNSRSNITLSRKSEGAPSPPPALATTSNVENEAPVSNYQNNVKKKVKSSAYRRFNIQKVREFRRGRSSIKR